MHHKASRLEARDDLIQCLRYHLTVKSEYADIIDVDVMAGDTWPPTGAPGQL